MERAVTEPYDDEPNFQPDEQQRESKDIRQLREKAKKYDEVVSGKTKAEQERDAAKRELAFVRAGIDLDSPAGKLAAKAYDGEPSIEAVRSFALEYGVLAPSEQDEADLDQQAALSRLSTGTPGARSAAGAKQITPDTFSSWDRATQMAFYKAHPREVEALKRGQAVPAVPGFV